MLISRENRSNFTGVLNNHHIADRAPVRHKQFASLAASALVALALCAPDSASAFSASATTFLTFGSNTSAGAIYVSAGGQGWAGISSYCLACVTQSISSGATDFSIDGANYNYNVPSTTSTAVPTNDGLGTYTQTVDFSKLAGGYGGTISLTQGGDYVFVANFDNIIITGIPGNNFVNLNIPYTYGYSNPTGSYPFRSSVPVSGNVDIYGTTFSPLTLTAHNAYNNSRPRFGGFTVDWSGTVSNTPISTSPIPEPSEWALMLGGLGLLGFIARRKNQNILAL